MGYPLKRRVADFFCDHPSINRRVLCIYHSLQEVNQLINPPQTEHTRKRNHSKNNQR